MSAKCQPFQSEFKFISKISNREIIRLWIEYALDNVDNINSLWPSDNIQCHRNWSTIVHMASYKLIYIGSGNGLLPDGTKPLPESTLTNHQWAFTKGQFQRTKISILDMSLKDTNSKWQLCIPGSNELKEVSKVICHSNSLQWQNTSQWDNISISLHWRHNARDSVSNHQPNECLLNCLFRCRSKKTSKLRVTGLCAGNSPGTGEFPAQMASNMENGSIWWHHHGIKFNQVFSKKVRGQNHTWEADT